MISSSSSDQDDDDDDYSFGKENESEESESSELNSLQNSSQIESSVAPIEEGSYLTDSYFEKNESGKRTISSKSSLNAKIKISKKVKPNINKN